LFFIEFRGRGSPVLLQRRVCLFCPDVPVSRAFRGRSPATTGFWPFAAGSPRWQIAEIFADFRLPGPV
jgi:hypothetical protein